MIRGQPAECYNIFRWYRAGWGKYTSPDPVAVGGLGIWGRGQFRRFALPNVGKDNRSRGSCREREGLGAWVVCVRCKQPCSRHRSTRSEIVTVSGNAMGRKRSWSRQSLHSVRLLHTAIRLVGLQHHVLGRLRSRTVSTVRNGVGSALTTMVTVCRGMTHMLRRRSTATRRHRFCRLTRRQVISSTNAMINLKVSFVDGKVVFDFGDDPIGFFTLFVASSRDETMWDVTPLSVQPVSVLESKMFGVRVPQEIGDAMLKQILPDTEDEPRYPLVHRVTYGQVPEGYREAVKAVPLIHGETYCVQVWGQGFFERTGQYFTGP